jgi:hypothetical protein
MSKTTAALIAHYYRQTHERVLKIVSDLTDEQWQRRPQPRAHSIAFVVWHLARWADHLRVELIFQLSEAQEPFDVGLQIWEAEKLADAWGLTSGELGALDTGMLMDENQAAALALPEKAVLLDYATRTFSAAQATINTLDDSQIMRPHRLTRGEVVGNVIFAYLNHDNRHLGEIELLRGLQGLQGTATR